MPFPDTRPDAFPVEIGALQTYSAAAMPNALLHAASPYLRQHANHPVAWVEWGPAAFAEARRRDVPVIVSIGYATCHWCHVMAHECFENETLADLMNRNYVCIKVDREELPEVDAIYIDAVRALTGRAGWPLNAFVDHDGRPFFVGTWFAPARWREVLQTLSDLWQNERPRIAEAATQLTEHLCASDRDVSGEVPPDLIERLSARLEQSWDEEHPGFSHAPKFPPTQLLQLISMAGSAFRGGASKVEAVLEAMQDAGLHDRIGGGFHRYATDNTWRVPHFEKMLYDNAQLAVAYAMAAVRTGRSDFARTALGIGNYLLRDMRVETPAGELIGYATAEDADDSGPESGEGGYYAVSPAHLRTVVDVPTAALLAASWDLADGSAHIGPSGHPEPVASHIPHPRGAPLATIASQNGFASIQALRASWEQWLPLLRRARNPRIRPMRDDKVLTDLNGLALSAFAALGRLAPEAGARARFEAATAELAEALAARHTPDGLLRLGAPAPRPGFVTDYGLLALGLLDAFQLLGDPQLVVRAEAIVDEAVARLAAPDGGFYTTPAGRTDLLRRSREDSDGPHPAGQHALALAAARLFELTGAERFATIADGVIRSRAAWLARAPDACPTLAAAHLFRSRGAIVVVVGGGAGAASLLAIARRAPDARVLVVDAVRCAAMAWPVLEGRRDAERPTAWVCEHATCLLPAHDGRALAASLALPVEAVLAEEAVNHEASP